MAKFSRYDPRNKKKDRNKNRTLSKDNRIRETERKTTHKFRGQNLNKVFKEDPEHVSE